MTSQYMSDTLVNRRGLCRESIAPLLVFSDATSTAFLERSWLTAWFNGLFLTQNCSNFKLKLVTQQLQFVFRLFSYKYGTILRQKHPV